MVDEFSDRMESVIDPVKGGEAVTTGVAFAKTSTGIYVGGSGDVTVTMLDGESLTFTGLSAGVIHPIRATVVTAATATNILALW